LEAIEKFSRVTQETAIFLSTKVLVGRGDSGDKHIAAAHTRITILDAVDLARREQSYVAVGVHFFEYAARCLVGEESLELWGIIHHGLSINEISGLVVAQKQILVEIDAVWETQALN
jgi:hypothetical protein